MMVTGTELTQLTIVSGALNGLDPYENSAENFFRSIGFSVEKYRLIVYPHTGPWPK